MQTSTPAYFIFCVKFTEIETIDRTDYDLRAQGRSSLLLLGVHKGIVRVLLIVSK